MSYLRRLEKRRMASRLIGHKHLLNVSIMHVAVSARIKYNKETLRKFGRKQKTQMMDNMNDSATLQRAHNMDE